VNGVDWGSFTLRLVRYAIALVRASSRGESPPEPPPPPSATRVDDRDAYVGTYTSSDARTLKVSANGGGLAISVDGGPAIGAFPTPGASSLRLVVPDSELDCFAVMFERDGDGQATAALHGARRFAAGDAAPPPGEINETSRTFEGHFESYNPWMPTIRIVQREGTLLLCDRSGMETPMAQIDETTFCLGDPALPERLRFDAIVDGLALRANASGCDYYRSFEP
jgi:hypothetical protein